MRMEDNEKKAEETAGQPEQQAADDSLNTIKLERHLWPDEKAKKELRSAKKRMRIWTCALTAAALLCGWLLGTLVPIRGFSGTRQSLSTLGTLDSSTKFQEILEIMSKDWFFANTIDDVSTRLTDQALTGMTTNDEDPHTAYMSKDEIDSFTQTINRNYVGIGVQYTQDSGLNVIERVFKNSPAEKAGVQAGDIIEAVDGTSVEGLSTTDISNMVRGDAGTDVVMDFLRNGSTLTLTITREEVSATVYGEVLDGKIGYLQIVQFGESTADEVGSYLTDFKSQGVSKLIIDLREDGGGYLDALQKIADYFLPEGTTVMEQVYADGTTELTKTTGGMVSGIGPIVLLVNQNTASAAEVFTLALKEQRSDVTTVGVTTYGKGTVQITRTFDDGSALKYTTSKWLSPSGVWVNGTGITPDVEVKLHDILSTSYEEMGGDETYAQDSVSESVKEAQMALDFLGYSVDRQDGYFSAATEAALKQFETDQNLTADGILDAKTYDALISRVVYVWNTDTSKDLQLQKAEEILNG